MKKILMTGCILASFLGLQSCDNENSVNPQPSLGTSTISGTVYAQLDETTAPKEIVPANTRIIAKVNTGDLVLTKDPNRVYPDKFYETTTNEDGYYLLEIEVATKNATVTLYPQDAIFSVIKDNPEAASTEDEKPFIQTNQTFKANPQSVIVYQGGSFIIDLAY